MLASTMSSHATGFKIPVLLAMTPTVMAMEYLTCCCSSPPEDYGRPGVFALKNTNGFVTDPMSQDGAGTYASVHEGVLQPLPKGFHERLAKDYIRDSDGDKHLIHYPIKVNKKHLEDDGLKKNVYDVVQRDAGRRMDFIVEPTDECDDYTFLVTATEAEYIDKVCLCDSEHYDDISQDDWAINQYASGLISIVFNVKISMKETEFPFQDRQLLTTLIDILGDPLRIAGYFTRRKKLDDFKPRDGPVIAELVKYAQQKNAELSYALSLYQNWQMGTMDKVALVASEYPRLITDTCDDKFHCNGIIDEAIAIHQRLPQADRNKAELYQFNKDNMRSATSDANDASANDFVDECCNCGRCILS